MTQPASVQADGSLAVLWVETLSLPTAPTVAELTAGSVINLSCYLTSTGFTPSTDEQVSTDPRLCSRQTFERAGRFTDRLQLMYVYNLLSSGDNQAYLGLVYLNEGFVVARWGEPYENVVTAGDIVDVYPAQCGIQQKQPPEENSVLKVTQTIHITGPVRRDVVVV